VGPEEPVGGGETPERAPAPAPRPSSPRHAPLRSSNVLEVVLEAMPARVFWKDLDSRYRGCNRAFARDAGLADPRDLIGRADAELAWHDQAEAYRRDDLAVMASGQPKLAYEEPQTTPDGKQLWLRTSKVPLRDPQGQVIGVLGMYENVTLQREQEAAARLTEQYQRALLDAFPFPAWLKDGASRFLAVNEPLARAWGLHPADLVGKTDLDFCARELAEAYRRDDRLVLESGVARLVEENLSVGGVLVWSETYKAPVALDGRILGTVGFARDITERREREEQLGHQREGSELKFAVAQAMQQPDLEFPARCDRALAGLRGLKGLREGASATLVLAAEEPGRGPALHGGGLCRRALLADLGREVACRARCDGPGPAHGHYLVPLFHGDLALGALVLDTEPEPTTHPARLDVLRGVGESLAQALVNERAAGALRAAKAQAEAGSLAKSRFLATMSHEIRTPMNGILGMAQLLAGPGVSEQERVEYATTLVQSGKTLLALLNDILDLAKIEAGKLTVESVPHQPVATLEEVRLLYAEAARRKGLALHATWEGPAARYLLDPSRLRQMLGNLVSNAVKFTPQGEVRMSAREVARDQASALLEWSVTDTGTGVPEAQRGSLFQAFSQLDASTTRRFGGSGLGLSIVRTLAEAMGGEVGMAPAAPRGSRFWFRVRAGLAEAAPAEAPSAVPGPCGPRPDDTSPASVLVVEDNPINRLVIERMLARRGFRVACVDDGARAVQRIEAGERPDLVLMDCQMPEVDGFEATRRIRRWEQAHGRARLPIVALTAGAYAEDRERCLDAGMDDFLTKPLDDAALGAALARWVHPRARPDQVRRSPV